MCFGGFWDSANLSSSRVFLPIRKERILASAPLGSGRVGALYIPFFPLMMLGFSNFNHKRCPPYPSMNIFKRNFYGDLVSKLEMSFPGRFFRGGGIF